VYFVIYCHKNPRNSITRAPVAVDARMIITPVFNQAAFISAVQLGQRVA